MVVGSTLLSSTDPKSEAGCISFSAVVPDPSSREGLSFCGIVTGFVSGVTWRRSAVVSNRFA